MAPDSDRDPGFSVLRHPKLGGALHDRRAVDRLPDRNVTGMALRLYRQRICSGRRCRSKYSKERRASSRFYDHWRSFAADWNAAVWAASISQLKRRADSRQEYRGLAVREF